MTLQLPDNVRQKLASEFRFATNQMAQAAGDFATQLYFFSIFFTETNRAFNQTWSDELALLHAVAQSVHRDLSQVVKAIMAGQHPPGLPPELPEALTRGCETLTELFESGRIEAETLYPILARLAEIAYASNGNGRYLYMKGQIPV
jgi:hypothetical protein